MVELLHVHNCVNTSSRALAWPRSSHNLTCVLRRPHHRLSSQVGFKSWLHPLAPKLHRIPASNPRIAAQTDNVQVASPESEGSPGTPQRGPKHHQPHQTWYQYHTRDLNLHLTRNAKPDKPERPVAGHAKCRLTWNMFQQSGLATYPRPAQLTLSRS